MAGIIERSEAPAGRDATSYREILRSDFWYSCAYCSMTESEAGGIGFQIDHYLPRALFPDLEGMWPNLMYSCQPCNTNKGDDYADDERRRRGLIVLRIDEEDPRDHIESDGDEVVGKTSCGEFTILLLHLNGQRLQRIRQLRRRLWESQGFVAHGVAEFRRFRLDRLTRKQRVLISHLRAQLEARSARMESSLEQLVRKFARSPLLDPDPDLPAAAAKRRAYLKEIRALGPPVSADRKAQPKKK